MYYKFFDMLHYNIQYMIYRERDTYSITYS